LNSGSEDGQPRNRQEPHCQPDDNGAEAVGQPEDEQHFILDGGSVKLISWEVVLLLGGGYALAQGFTYRLRAVALVGEAASSVEHAAPLPLLLLLCLLTSVLTEFLQNSAAASILVPVISSTAQELRLNPLVLLVPVVCSCSLAFCSLLTDCNPAERRGVCFWFVLATDHGSDWHRLERGQCRDLGHSDAYDRRPSLRD
jgi:hypothetical protein